MNFFQILVRKGREQYLPEIMNEFMVQYRLINKISTVHLTTASELSDATVQSIKTKLTSAGVAESNIDLNLVVDPELIGGFKIETSDKLYDATIAKKLDNLRKEFKGNIFVSKIISK
jgi:F-type H+-transporting ATPase subunit delta